MLAASDHSQPEISSYLQDILDAPEHPDLRRLTTMVEHLFRVPVAYMALLGAGNSVVARIGNGTEYAPYLKKLQLDNLLEEPQLVRDSACDLPPGTDFADLRFGASAPLRSTSNVQLGVLVIADRVPRPDFSSQDARTLAELANVLAGKMELRMIASLALESELSLRETERRFRGIANCAPVMLIYSGADGSCQFVNKTWLDFSGRTREDELEQGWAELIHPEYRERVLYGYWQAFESLQPFATEAPFLRHDGQYRWMLDKCAPRFRDDGSFAGYVSCLLDLTDHHDTLEALRQQSQFTEAVAEAAHAFFLVLDPDGRIVDVSPSCRSVAGDLFPKIVGGLVWETCDAAIPSAETIQGAVKQAVEGKEVVRIQTPDLEWTFTPIEREGGGLSAIIATVFELRAGQSTARSCVTIHCVCRQPAGE